MTHQVIPFTGIRPLKRKTGPLARFLVSSPFTPSFAK